MELSFQLHEFLVSKPQAVGLVDTPNRHVIKHLIKNNLRPPRPLASRKEPYPASWEQPETFRLAVQIFEKGTETLQTLLRLPPSTGASPEQSTMATELGESSKIAGKRPEPRLGTADIAAGQIEEITGLRKDSGNPQYSKTAYQRDSIGILMIVGRIAKKDPGYDLPFLRGSISNTEVGAAQAVYRLLSDSKKKSCQTEAQQQLLSSDSPQYVLGSQEVFQDWITRFREGPGEPGALDLSPELIDEVVYTRQATPVEIINPRIPMRQPQNQTYGSEKLQRSLNSRRLEEVARNRPDFLQRSARVELDRPDPFDLEVEEGLDRNMRHQSSVDPLAVDSPPRRRQIPRATPWLPRQDARPERLDGIQPNIPPPNRSVEDELAYLRARVAQQEAELRNSRNRDPGPEFVPRQNRRLESIEGPQYAYPPPQPRGYPDIHDRDRPDRPLRGHSHPNVQNDRLPPRDSEHLPDYPREKPRNLRPADVMMFDPKKQSAAFFIRRFLQIAELEGSGPVLRVLPMCLEGDALEWHNGLSARVRREMNQSLAIWEDELLREYRPNRFESMKTAEKMKFRFDDSSITLSQYLTRKTNHLHDAGIMDEDMIVRYLWQGLDANLALATPMREEGDTIESFNRRVRNNEAAAKRVHEINKPRQKSTPSTGPTPARVQRLFGNLAAKGLVQTAESKAKPDTKPKRPLEPSNNKANERRPKRAPPRPCRHCGGGHWDNDCDEKDRKVLKVDPEAMEIDEDGSEAEDLDAYDLETYEALEILAEEETQGENDCEDS